MSAVGMRVRYWFGHVAEPIRRSVHLLWSRRFSAPLFRSYGGGAVTGIADRMLPPAEETGGPTRHTGRTLAIAGAAAGLLLLALVVFQMVRPLPSARLRLVTPVSRTLPGALRLPWPAGGQAVLEVDGLGRMGASGGVRPTPTASVAKVMTAYVFLQDHPLRGGEEGPTYHVSPEEAARLPWRIARDETHVDVVANQPFTEREALEALMIVSANNIAHEIARWDAGGDVPFAAKMNAMARRLGMTGTHYTDPSGFDATTVSTAADQVRLFSAAMRIPAFAEVVSKPTFTPRGGGETRSGANTLLGSYGVIGGKTGFTSTAGGNYVFAARTGGRTLIGAVMGQLNTTSSAVAVSAAQSLILAAESSLTRVTLAPRGAVVARVDDGFGHRIPLAATVPVTATGWPGLTLRLSVRGKIPRHAPAGRTVASVTAGGEHTALRLARPLRAPGLLDRLIRLG
jgi:D-alanyl-D-alanine carboxypeptidase